MGRERVNCSHLNQITGLSAGGTTWFRGKVNEPANVTLNGQNARVHADGTFEPSRGIRRRDRQTGLPVWGEAPRTRVERPSQLLTELGAGVHDVFVQATDKAGNVTSETWRVDNGSASGAVPTHDLEGNLLTDGHYIYTWDARNRMTSVTVGADTWSFAYDGKNRRIAENKNSTLVREWVWDGASVVEERLANGTKHRFWTGGIGILNSSNQQIGKRLTVTDHLGSTRVVVDGTNGAMSASYDYAPWGQRTRINGTEDWSTGYTGHWWHESGLSLAVYRPYDPRTGRWSSRDPIGEKGGVNLYEYCNGATLSMLDLTGLAPYTFVVQSMIMRTWNGGPDFLHNVPGWALGIKSYHLLTVDDNSGAILDEYTSVGKTGIIPAGHSEFNKSVSLDLCWMKVRMWGKARNFLNRALSYIDWDVAFYVTWTGKVSLVGKHDGYPSYIMSASGGAYYFDEISPIRLQPPMEINVRDSW